MSAATASHAPAGAKPRQIPSHRWQSQEYLLTYGYIVNTATGNQAIIKATSFNCQAPKRSIERNPMESKYAVCIVIEPETKCRLAVRGFSASTSRSIIRLRAIASPLAPIAATRIQSKSIPNF